MRPTRIVAVLRAFLLVMAVMPGLAQEPSKEQRPVRPYCIVDTGQKNIFADREQLLKVPKPSAPFFGQDGFYQETSQRSQDPANFPQGRGPQGDAIRIYNYVRPVRSMDPKSVRLVEPDLASCPTVVLLRRRP